MTQIFHLTRSRKLLLLTTALLTNQATMVYAQGNPANYQRIADASTSPAILQYEEMALSDGWESGGAGWSAPSAVKPVNTGARTVNPLIQPKAVSAVAAPPPDNIQSGDSGIFVGSISIIGSDELAVGDFAEIVEANLGQELDEEDLRKLTQDIAEHARDRGYVFASAYIPEQDIKFGNINVLFEEGRIDEVRIKGADNVSLANMLNSLVGGRAMRGEIERKLTLANDIPKIRVRETRFLKYGQRNILEVTVSERKNAHRAGIDNYGSDRHGPLRAKLSLNFNGVLSGTDEAGVTVRTNPVDPEEFAYASAYYSTAIGNDGTRVGAAGSIGKTTPGGANFGNVEGDSRYLSAFASHPIVRSKSASLWINAEAEYLSIEQDDLAALIREDTQATFSVGLSSNIKFLGGRLRTGASLVQGFDVLGATRLGDPQASRFDGDGVFTKGVFHASWRGRLTGNLGLYLRARGQIANRPLLAAQEFNIGGPYSARGFDFSELSGENGFSGLAEINYSFKKPTSWIKKLQPFAFIDGGYVTNLDSGFGSGTLVSAGGGIRADIWKLDLELEAAVPLNRDRDNSGDRSPHLNVQVGLDF